MSASFVNQRGHASTGRRTCGRNGGWKVISLRCHPRNAAWELFSRQQDRIRHGAAYYPHRHRGAWELLRQLYVTYALEEPNMAYTMEEFIREAHQQFLHGLTPDERRAFLEQLSPEERLRGLGPEERLRGLDPDQIKAYLKKFEH